MMRGCSPKGSAPALSSRATPAVECVGPDLNRWKTVGLTAFGRCDFQGSNRSCPSLTSFAHARDRNLNFRHVASLVTAFAVGKPMLAGHFVPRSRTEVSLCSTSHRSPADPYGTAPATMGRWPGSDTHEWYVAVAHRFVPKGMMRGCSPKGSAPALSSRATPAVECVGPDLNRRTPTGQRPQRCAVGLAWLPTHCESVCTPSVSVAG